MLGTPCLVTPFSQYVKNAALMNLYSKSMDEKPFTRMDPAMWGMVLGKSGKLPGELAPEIVEIAKEKGFEFYTDDPQVLYPNELPRFEKEMKENGWDRGQDDEELFEFAMHEKQYREYKSGQAKDQFNKDLLERMEKKQNGGAAGAPVKHFTAADKRAILHPDAEPIEAAASGRVFWDLDYMDQSCNPPYGKHYKKGDWMCGIQAIGNTFFENTTAPHDCHIVAVEKEHGSLVTKGEVIGWIGK